MLIIVSALHDEAAPMIEHLGLKRDIASKTHHVFLSEQCFAVISGVGKLRSAIATTRAILEVKYGQDAGRFEKTPILAANLGTCAARPGYRIKNIEIGSLFLAHRIVDHASSRAFHPDILVDTALPSATLETFDLPVSSSASLAADSDLADMEAAGFYEAACAFLPPSSVFCFKVVSDILDSEDYGASFANRNTIDLKQFAELAQGLILRQTPKLLQALTTLQNSLAEGK